MAGGWNDALFEALNGLSGRSFTLDALLALAMTDPVAKAGPLVACFAYAWWKPGNPARRERRRRILLVTLLALFVIAPLMKVFSLEIGTSPRPLLRGEQVYLYSPDSGIEKLAPLDYRPPTTGETAMRHAALREREIEPNDLASFPSDHAALFLALAVGIMLAAPGAGALAVLWALVVSSGARVVTGMHSPLDILAGGAMGIGLLLAAQLLARALPAHFHASVQRALERWPGWAAAVMALLLLEVASTMGLLRRLAELAGSAMGAAA